MAKLKWRDSTDVYKPANRSLREFLQERKERLIELDAKDLDAKDRKLETLYREISSNQMNVFVEPQSVDQLKNHLSIDPYNETGGVLVGQAYFCETTKTQYTEITGSIAAPYTIGNRVHFQFTPECWQSILANQKLYFPETTVVGWYHSHPGHGIFLSGTDLNTQRLSFKQIWQIAVVYDPLRKEIGFFYGADGKTIRPIYWQRNNQLISSQAVGPQLPIIPGTDDLVTAQLNNNPPQTNTEPAEIPTTTKIFPPGGDPTENSPTQNSFNLLTFFLAPFNALIKLISRQK